MLSKNLFEKWSAINLQWTQITAMRGTPIEPTSKPAFLNASGIANIPVPIFPLSRWTIVSQFLLNEQIIKNNV